MTFSFDISDELKVTIKILKKKDKKMAEILKEKIKQISQCNEMTIDHFKNLRHGLKEYKRVHIARNFVLLFKVLKKENHILFHRFGHHDDIYR